MVVFENQNQHKYDDIIHKKYPLNTRDMRKHPPMSIEDRAKIFSPFAALRGHEKAIVAKQKIVVPRIELSEEMKEYLDQQLNKIEHLLEENQHPMITIVYFKKDLTMSEKYKYQKMHRIQDGHEIQKMHRIQDGHEIQKMHRIQDGHEIQEMHRIQDGHEIQEMQEMHRIQDGHEIQEMQRIQEEHGILEVQRIPEDYEMQKEEETQGENGEYIQFTGMVAKLDVISRVIQIVDKKFYLKDIYRIEF